MNAAQPKTMERYRRHSALLSSVDSLRLETDIYNKVKLTPDTKQKNVRMYCTAGVKTE